MEWDEATKALIKDVAESAAEKTVTQVLTGLGVDASDPLSVQRDMQFIRSMRQSWDTAKNNGLIVGTGIMITGFVTYLWLAIKASIAGSHG